MNKQWLPVDDGEYSGGGWRVNVTHHGATVGIGIDHPDCNTYGGKLPEGLAVCRLVAAEGQVPQMPDYVAKKIRKMIGFERANSGWSTDLYEVEKWLDTLDGLAENGASDE